MKEDSGVWWETVEERKKVGKTKLSRLFSHLVKKNCIGRYKEARGKYNKRTKKNDNFFFPPRYPQR